MPQRQLNRRLGVQGLEDRRLLATLTVTTTDDLVAEDGVLSLREAVAVANNNVTLEGFTGTPGTDRIRFDPALDGQTIALTDGQLRLTESVIIEGRGAGKTTIFGNNASRLFELSDFAREETFAFIGLKLSGGNANVESPAGGGAVRFYSLNQSRLLFRDVFLSENSAETGGALRLTGGIANIDGTTVADNDATWGGGLALHNSRVVVTNSTITNNTATDAGGGIEHFSFDVPSLGDASLDLINVTLIDNSASGGRNLRNGSQGPDSVVRFGNSLIFGGSGGRDVIDSPTVEFGNVASVSLGNNILDHNVDAQSLVSDLRLLVTDGFALPLADNGGLVPTRELVPLAQAVDFGNNQLVVDPGADFLLGTADDSVRQSDQRGSGFGRIVDGGSGQATVDAGAFERQQTISAPADLVVTSTADELFPAEMPNLDDLTLRQAVELSNLMLGSNSISFASNLFGSTITLIDRSLFIRDELQLIGPGDDQIVLDANHDNRHIVFQTNEELGITLLVQGLTLINGKAPSFGGAIFALRNRLVVRESEIRNNETPGRGGAIFANRTETHVVDSRLNNNIAGGKGGAISYFNASGSLTGVTAIGNSAANGGAGFHAIVTDEQADSDIEIIDSFFSENVSSPGNDLLLDSTVASNRVELTFSGSIFGSAGTPWQNPLLAADVNNSGLLEPGDALRVINELERKRFTQEDSDALQAPTSFDVFPDLFLDVSGDGNLSALDALRVINALARAFNAELESIDSSARDRSLETVSDWFEEDDEDETRSS